MPRKKIENFYDAGVYCFRNRKTDDSYVGMSVNLRSRIKYRLNVIAGSTSGMSTDRRFVAGFAGCSLNDVEVSVLERVKIPRSEDFGKKYGMGNTPREPTPGLDLLYAREVYWINRLRPTLNFQHARATEAA